MVGNILGVFFSLLVRCQMAGHTCWHSAVIWWYIKYYSSLVQPHTALCGTGTLGEQGHRPARPLAMCCRGQSHTTWAYSPFTGIVLSSVSQWPLLPHYQCRQEHHHYMGQIFDEQENKCDDWYLFTVCIYGISLMYFTTRYSNSLSLLLQTAFVPAVAPHNPIVYTSRVGQHLTGQQ